MQIMFSVMEKKMRIILGNDERTYAAAKSLQPSRPIRTSAYHISFHVYRYWVLSRSVEIFFEIYLV